MEVLAKGPLLDWTNDGKLHQEEGFNFMQRPCNEQVRSRVCLFMCLSVVGRVWAEQIFSTRQRLTDNRKKWEKHLERVEEQCKPRGSKLVTTTQYKVLTRGGMELPEYIEKCRQITDACGWPEEAKDMALRNAILLDLKNQNVY